MYNSKEARNVEIEGTILHSEFIPGRKNVFIQNFESESSTTSSESPNPPENDEEDIISIQTQIQTQTQTQIQSQTQKTLVKNSYGLSVEQVALTHYINKTQAYTHGKHAETATLRTLFGLLFWHIIFDSSVPNVFVDRFQSAPLDLQTEHFYLSRKKLIDAKLDLLNNSPIEFVCDLITQIWQEFRLINLHIKKKL